MSIRKSNIKKLPKGETYVAPIRRIRKAFDENLDISLSMTNDTFSFDSAVRKRPVIPGVVVLSASYSKYQDSRLLHFYKVHETSIGSDLLELFSSKIMEQINHWFKTINNHQGSWTHSCLIYSVNHKQVHTNEITWNR